MKRLLEKINIELEKSESTVISKAEILALHDIAVSILLKNKDIREELDDKIMSLSKTLGYVRLLKFLNNYIPSNGVDVSLAKFVNKLLNNYIQLLSGKMPLTSDMRVPIKIVKGVNAYRNVFKVNEGDILLLPLNIALILVSLDIAVIVK